jgi:thymidylate kinase
MSSHPNYIVFDGLDGGGKTTIAKAFVDELVRRGHDFFDLTADSKTTGDIPMQRDGKNEVIFCSEPTHAWTGAAIRKELIRKGTSYSPSAVGQAYALDRMILLQRFIIPTLQAGAKVISDRSVSTSMVYQPIMGNGMSLDKLLSYEGNQLALNNAPGHLVIVKASVKTCLARINARSNKADDAIFEKEEFLNKAADRFNSEWFQQLWAARGTTIHYFDAEQSLETVKANAARLANEIFLTNGQS